MGQWNADRLCDAVRANDIQTVSLCLKHVSPNERETTHFTPLRLAALYGHSPILRLLLEAQATVDERDSGGGTALLKASRAGHLECVELLLASQAQPNQQTTGFRDTPLMQAAAQGTEGCKNACAADDTCSGIMFFAEKKYKNKR